MKSYKQFSEEAQQLNEAPPLAAAAVPAIAGIASGLADWGTKQVGKLIGAVGKQAKKRLIGKDHSRGHSQSTDLTGPKSGS